MKAITKIMPIIQVIWVYAVIAIIAILGNEVSLPYLLIAILCIVINILTIVSAVCEKKEFKKLALINMFLKIIFIPYYLFVFFLALGASVALSLTKVGIVMLPVVYYVLFALDYALLCTTSTFGVSTLTIAKKNGCISKTLSIILAICHYIFVLDLLASIILYFIIRKKNDTAEDAKFRKATRIFLIVFILLSIIVGGFVAFLQKAPNSLYHKNTYTESEIKAYMEDRFENADKKSFFSNPTESRDENNKLYTEWSITINDIHCHVASMETEVKNSITTQTFYRAETDYDYFALKKYIDDNTAYSLFEMESTYSTRYDEHSVYVNYSMPIDGLDANDLQKIEKAIKQIASDSDKLLIQKEIKFKLNKKGKDIYITKDTTNQLYVDI